VLEIILLICVLVLASVSVWLGIKVQKIEKEFGIFFSHTQPQPIMRALNQYAEKIQKQAKDIDKIQSNLTETTILAEKAGTRLGFVRFNPFNDTGGDQSFCLAIIDSLGNGYILSSIHARTGTRVYAKPVQQGHSSHNLSEEESAALAKATKQNPRDPHAH
jgi:hypothetical protein